MKAISPVRSFRKNNSTLSEHSLGISRSKTPVDDPLSLLYNMNDCYSKLKELVPSIPQNKSVSKMEILQHVIDYILDLQIALDSSVALSSLHHPARPGQQQQQQQPSRTPLTTLNTDISILSLQVITPSFETRQEDKKAAWGFFFCPRVFLFLRADLLCVFPSYSRTKWLARVMRLLFVFT